MIGKKVLLIDDDVDFLKMISLIFQEAGARPLLAQDSLEAMGMLFTQKPDLIILDAVMPEIDGFQVCQHIRRYFNTPLIMLSALDLEENMLKSLEAGADDLIAKPVKPEILLARCRALLRRGQHSNDSTELLTYDDGYLEVDLQKHRVLVRGKQAKLTPVEFRMLAYLVSNAGRVLPFDQILFKVWGSMYEGNDDYIHVYVSHLRSKIEQDSRNPRYILSVHGIGYIFEKQDHVEKDNVINGDMFLTSNGA